MDMSMMSLGFGLLFGGMAAKMFADTAIKTFTTAFMTLADEQHAAVKGVLEIQAAFAYLKFTLFEVFAQTELFQTLVTYVVEIAVWLANIAQQNPALIAIAGAFILILYVVGMLAMPLGNIALLLLAIQTTGLPTLMLFLTVMYAILIVVSAVAAIVLIWNSNMTKTEKILSTIVVVVLAVVAAMFILGLAVSLPFLIAIAVIGVLVATFWILSDKLGGLGYAFLGFGVFLLWLLALVADGLINSILVPINLIIDAINTVIRSSNALLGTNWDTLDHIEFSVAKKVDILRDDLLAKGEARKAEQSSSQQSSGPLDLSQNTIEGIGQMIAQYMPVNSSTNS
jgi:hypothetical protein